MPAKPTRGGARKGAGRPPTGRTEQLKINVTPELRERVREAAEAREESIVDYVSGVLDRATKRTLA